MVVLACHVLHNKNIRPKMFGKFSHVFSTKVGTQNITNNLKGPYWY